MSLLDQNTFEPVRQVSGKNHVRKPDRGGLHGEKIGKFPPWFKNNQLARSAVNGCRPAFGFFDQFAKLLRNGGVAQFRLMSGSLHGNGQEFPVVTFNVALEERNHVAC